MKLIKLRGTKTEQDIRKQLTKSHIALFHDEKKIRFLNTLKDNFPQMKTAYILYWVPEQGEDMLTCLINTDLIAEIEIDRYDLTAKPIVEFFPLDYEYIKKHRKISQITIAIALELAKSDISIQ
jgi:hypothetical protein